MKNAYYYFGDYKCTAYCREYGQGWEVGFFFGKTQIFVGNFIHKAEAMKWWTMMAKELKSFTTRYAVGEDFNWTWYSKFLSKHLYRAYYTFLDQQFAKYHKTFAKQFAAEERKYKTFSKKWGRKGAAETVAFKRAG